MPSSSKTTTSSDDRLDLLFRALGDRTRRALLAGLVEKSAMVTELAEPFAMSLPAVSRHIRVLERAQLVVKAADRARADGSKPDRYTTSNLRAIRLSTQKPGYRPPQ